MTRQNAAERVEKAVARLKEKEKTTELPRSYAQAARIGNAYGKQTGKGVAEEAPKENPKEGRKILITISDRKDAEEIGKQPKEDIVGRVSEGAGETHGKCRVIAMQHLKSRDIVLHASETMLR